MGSRYNAVVDEATNLVFQFLKDGVNFDAYAVSKVEIYPTYADAQNSTNRIELISSGSITKIDTGRYSYTAAAIDTAGTYFDKIYLTPEDDIPERSFISPFYVRKEQVGGAPPDEIEKATILLNVFDITGDRDKVVVKVRMNKTSVWYNNELITQKLQTFEPDNDGIVTMDLVETTTLGADVYYIVDIGGFLKEKIKVPKGTIQEDYKNLPRVT